MIYFPTFGPHIKVKIIPVGDAEINFKSEVISSGINQSMYRIYLEIKTNINIISAVDKKNTQVITQVPIAEIVIVGGVPQTYYNLQGIKELSANETMEFIEN